MDEKEPIEESKYNPIVEALREKARVASSGTIRETLNTLADVIESLETI